MENASKALIFAASTLIAIILLSMMVYIFRRFGDTAASTEKRMSEEELLSFNAKFVNYDTGGTYSEDDEFSITTARTFDATTGLEVASNTRYVKYRDLFRDTSTNTLKERDYYNKALISAAHNLNKVSDVVTCINDAININNQNNNGYKYSTNNDVEIQNSVEVIVDLGSYKNEFKFSLQDKSIPTSAHYQYLVIEPSKFVKAKHIYGLKAPYALTTSGENTTNKITNVNNFAGIYTDSNAVSVYDMLEELRETKYISQDGKSYTVYKYYFFGEVIVNDYTGQIETVKFTLVKDKNF